MAKCEICGKNHMRASNLSYRSSQMTRRTLTHKKANVQRVRVDLNGNPVRMYICSKCLKNINGSAKSSSANESCAE